MKKTNKNTKKTNERIVYKNYSSLKTTYFIVTLPVTLAAAYLSSPANLAVKL